VGRCTVVFGQLSPVGFNESKVNLWRRIGGIGSLAPKNGSGRKLLDKVFCTWGKVGK
jgi:hypothetical protein